MNKLAFSTVVRDDADAPELLAQIARAGFDGVEPTFVPEGGLPCVADPRRSAEKLAKLAGDAGLAIASMRGGPTFWPTFGSPDPTLRKQAVDNAAAALEAVQLMGGDTLLIVPGAWGADQTYQQMWDHALDTTRRIAQIAQRFGVTVALENVENQFLMSPSEWGAFLDQVGSEHVGMYFDVGNVVWLRRGCPRQWINQLGRKYIRRVHFKDGDQGGKPRYLLEGDVDWPAVTEALRGIGYDDWVAVELDLPRSHRQAMLGATHTAARAILK